jgi:hypothetical protein
MFHGWYVTNDFHVHFAFFIIIAQVTIIHFHCLCTFAPQDYWHLVHILIQMGSNQIVHNVILKLLELLHIHAIKCKLTHVAIVVLFSCITNRRVTHSCFSLSVTFIVKVCLNTYGIIS